MAPKAGTRGGKLAEIRAAAWGTGSINRENYPEGKFGVLDYKALGEEDTQEVAKLIKRCPSTKDGERVAFLQKNGGYFPANPELDLYGFGLLEPQQGTTAKWRRRHTAIRDEAKVGWKINTWPDQRNFEDSLRLSHCICPYERTYTGQNEASSVTGTPVVSTVGLPDTSGPGPSGLRNILEPPGSISISQPTSPTYPPPRDPSSEDDNDDTVDPPLIPPPNMTSITLKNTAKVNAPRDFDGTPSKCDRFLRELKVYKRLKPNDFETEEEWIFWGLGYMRGSDFVEAWAASVIDAIDGVHPASEFYYSTWSNFLQGVEDTFGDSGKAGTAREEMRTLKQKEGETVEQFYHRFREVASRMESSDADTFMEFKARVKPFISMCVASHDPEPRTLSAWATKAIAIDRQLRRNSATVAFLSKGKKAETSAPSPSSRLHFSTGTGPGPRVLFSSPSSTSTQHAPSISQRVQPSLSQSFRPSQPGPSGQHTLCIRNIRCWFCKQEGHISTQCPNKKTISQMTHQEIHQMVGFYQDLEEVTGHFDVGRQEKEEEEIDTIGLDELDLADLDFQHQGE